MKIAISNMAVPDNQKIRILIYKTVHLANKIPILDSLTKYHFYRAANATGSRRYPLSVSIVSAPGPAMTDHASKTQPESTASHKVIKLFQHCTATIFELQQYIIRCHSFKRPVMPRCSVTFPGRFGENSNASPTRGKTVQHIHDQCKIHPQNHHPRPRAVGELKVASHTSPSDL